MGSNGTWYNPISLEPHICARRHYRRRLGTTTGGSELKYLT
jgi:hypothetical protein